MNGGSEEFLRYIDGAKVKRVVREYVSRAQSLSEALHGGSDDSQIDCPKCGGFRSIVWDGGWECRSGKQCGFEFSQRFIPPAPEELKEFFEEERRARKRQEIQMFLRRALTSSV